MQPLLLGEPTEQIYAVYHPALPNKKNAQGVVMCYPLGHEYMRIHAIYKQMANRLASAGFDVIRFDCLCLLINCLFDLCLIVC